MELDEEMNSEQYKQYHESQMVNIDGSSVFEVETVLTSVSLGVFLRLWLKFHVWNQPESPTFLLDFLLISLPVVFEVTVMSGVSYVIPLHMFLLLFVITLTSMKASAVDEILSRSVENKKSYITNYRASTNLVSCLCILAVDFAVFPRRFAKTETFGFALMDLGVGYFICSNGLVAKNTLSWNNFAKVLKSTSVLIALGFVRLLSVKSTNYHEHASEYGVHWNFFFTLGFCRIVSYIILMGSCVRNPAVLAVIVGVVHQGLLLSGLEEWVLSSTPRDTLLSANREGLTSLLGYVTLYFASVAVSEVINKQSNDMTYKKILIRLILLSIGLWTCTWVCHCTIGVSRREANSGYVFWIVSSTVTVLLEFVLIDIIISSIEMSSETKLTNKSQVPDMMQAINSNGLFFFLFSNLLTGLINMTFQTLLLDSVSALSLIILYQIVLCWISYVFYRRSWILKFW